MRACPDINQSRERFAVGFGPGFVVPRGRWSGCLGRSLLQRTGTITWQIELSFEVDGCGHVEPDLQCRPKARFREKPCKPRQEYLTIGAWLFSDREETVLGSDFCQCCRPCSG